MRLLWIILISVIIISSCNKDYKICRSCDCGDVKTATGDLVVDSLTFYTPTIFTPNGDGLNDLFTPVYETQKVKSLKLEIYSRDKKRKLFSSTDPSVFWDGKDSEKRECGQRIFAWEFSGFTTWNRAFTLSGEIFLSRNNCYDGSDYNKCRYADQIIPSQGFVLPTAERKCD